MQVNVALHHVLYKVRQDYTLLLMDQQLKDNARYATHHTDVLGTYPVDWSMQIMYLLQCT